jgi:RHS repeat-associated protein
LQFYSREFTTLQGIYDGGNVIAEYDDNGDLASKYIHGARIDELVCMINVADSNAVYYYHYDGLGSVVALSDSSGDSCQSYEYSAFGQVVAEDPNHPNPYMFTGRRFDYETGLYYYRARYYNPYIGRFLQTDPIGYKNGINWHAYRGNNPPSQGNHGNNVVNQKGKSGIFLAIIVPRVMIPEYLLPPTGKDKNIPSGAPTGPRLVWHALTGRGVDLNYTDSEACWDWAKDDDHWMGELKREMTDFVLGFWIHARNNNFDRETNTFNLDGWDYEYALSGTYTTRDNPYGYKLSFGAEEAENGYSKTDSKFWIHNSQVKIDYSFSFSEDGRSCTMTADFTLIDWMNLESDKYQFDEALEKLFPFYKPYDLNVSLGSHTIGWSMIDGLTLDGQIWEW